MASFTCQDCGQEFTLPQHVLDRYPGWEPKQCMACRDRARGKPRTSRKKSRSKDVVLTTDEVLAEFTEGPENGVFTDGGSVPNPGPGGWGAVYVVDGEIMAEASGHDPDTTNNRMELTAALEAVRLVPEGVATTIYADSKLVVSTVNEWAAGWKERGWRRKTGAVENLDLVRPLYEAFQSRPELKLEWIAAHSGYRWNEYADALASKWRA